MQTHLGRSSSKNLRWNPFRMRCGPGPPKRLVSTMTSIRPSKIESFPPGPIARAPPDRFFRTFASRLAVTLRRPYAMGVFFPCFYDAFPYASGTIAEQKLSKISPFVHFSALFLPCHCSIPPFSPFDVQFRLATPDLTLYNSLMLRSSEKALTYPLSPRTVQSSFTFLADGCP